MLFDLNRVQRLYNKGNYELALEILESNTSNLGASVLKGEHELVCNTLELRAALYTKQGLLQKAIEDAVTMISLDKKGSRGHLRLAHAFYTLGKFRDAQLTCRKARKTVMDEGIKSIESLERKASAKLREQQIVRVDPLRALPLELAIMVLEQALSTTRDAAQARCVSKLWQSTVDSIPSLWYNIVVGPQGTSTLSKQSSILNSCKLATDGFSLNVSGTQLRNGSSFLETLARKFPDKMVKFVAGRDPSSFTVPLLGVWRKLDLELGGLTHLSMSSDSLDGDLSWALGHLPSLQKIELRESSHRTPSTIKTLPPIMARQLRSITLVGLSGVTPLHAEFVDLLSSIGTLEQLSLHRCVKSLDAMASAFSNRHLKGLQFTGQGVAYDIIPLPTPELLGEITVLVLNNVALSFSKRFADHPLPLKYLELKWADTQGKSLADIIEYFGCASTLETLVIHQTFLASLRDDRNNVVLPKLRKLSFTKMPALSYKTLDWLTRALPAVRYLNFDDSQISSPVIIKLVRSGVKELRCRNCSLSYDTIEWLRQRQVRFSMA